MSIIDDEFTDKIILQRQNFLIKCYNKFVPVSGLI